MQLVADDLRCPACQGYVHLVLARCPACGTGRDSRLDDVMAGGPVGAGALLEDEATHDLANQVVLRYTLRSSSGRTPGDLAVAFGTVAGSLTYSVEVAADGPTPALPGGPTTLNGASVLLVEGALAVRTGPSGRAIATIPLDAILAATPIVKGVPAPASWTGVVLGDRQLLPARLLPGGDLLVTFSSGGAAGQLSIANRRGLLAPSARPDHYLMLAGWLGILGAAAAEARWQSVGPAAYAAELGLGAPEAARATRESTGTPAGAIADLGRVPAADGGPAIAASGAAGPPSGVRAALVELEDLRGAGLVTDAEYAAKRREILARL